MQITVITAITARNEMVITPTTGGDVGKKGKCELLQALGKAIWQCLLKIENVHICKPSSSTPGKLPHRNKSISE